MYTHTHTNTHKPQIRGSRQSRRACLHPRHAGHARGAECTQTEGQADGRQDTGYVGLSVCVCVCVCVCDLLSYTLILFLKYHHTYIHTHTHILTHTDAVAQYSGQLIDVNNRLAGDIAMLRQRFEKETQRRKQYFNALVCDCVV
jgi:hypothetical protein